MWHSRLLIAVVCASFGSNRAEDPLAASDADAASSLLHKLRETSAQKTVGVPPETKGSTNPQQMIIDSWLSKHPSNGAVCLVLDQSQHSNFLPHCSQNEVLIAPHSAASRHSTGNTAAKVTKGDLAASGIYPNNHFDAVYLTEVLEHVLHPDTVVQNLFQMVKPGGQVIVTEPFVSKINPDADDYLRYTPQAMKAIFEDAGFRTKEVVGAGNEFTTMAAQWKLNPQFASEADLEDTKSNLPSATLGCFTKPMDSKDGSNTEIDSLERLPPEEQVRKLKAELQQREQEQEEQDERDRKDAVSDEEREHQLQQSQEEVHELRQQLSQQQQEERQEHNAFQESQEQIRRLQAQVQQYQQQQRVEANVRSSLMPSSTARAADSFGETFAADHEQQDGLMSEADKLENHM